MYGFEELYTCRALSMQTIRTKNLILFGGAALIGGAILSLPGLAQDEALKNCRADWRASQAALRANGINQKMFIAECEAAAAARSGAASTGPGSPEPQMNPASATPPTTAGETLKVKECVEEWRTKRRTKRGIDELQGLTEKAYVEQCRRGSTSSASPR